MADQSSLWLFIISHKLYHALRSIVTLFLHFGYTILHKIDKF
jgi:hypothetical protein